MKKVHRVNLIGSTTFARPGDVIVISIASAMINDEYDKSKLKGA